MHESPGTREMRHKVFFCPFWTFQNRRLNYLRHCMSHTSAGKMLPDLAMLLDLLKMIVSAKVGRYIIGSDKKTTTQTAQLPMSSAVTALHVGSHHADTPGCDLMNNALHTLTLNESLGS